MFKNFISKVHVPLPRAAKVEPNTMVSDLSASEDEDHKIETSFPYLLPDQTHYERSDFRSPVEPSTLNVSAADRAFYYEAKNVFSQRFTDSPDAIPLANPSLPANTLVRYNPEDGKVLVIQTNDDCTNSRRDKGLVLRRLAGGDFQILRDGEVVTNPRLRDADLCEIRRHLNLSVTRRPPKTDSGRLELNMAMQRALEQVTVEKRMGDSRVHTVLNAGPNSENQGVFHPHVTVFDGKVALKMDKLLNYKPAGLERNALGLRNDIAHDFIHRFHGGPLSKTLHADVPVRFKYEDKPDVVEDLPMAFTGSQVVVGEEVPRHSKPTHKLHTLLFIAGVTDVLEEGGHKISGNVIFDAKGEQQAFDLFDEKSTSTIKPNLFHRGTKATLGMPVSQVAQELERARAHAMRRIDQKIDVQPIAEAEAARASVNKYVNECLERLSKLHD
jgi:hypothetical protein